MAIAEALGVLEKGIPCVAVFADAGKGPALVVEGNAGDVTKMTAAAVVKKVRAALKGTTPGGKLLLKRTGQKEEL